MHETTRDRRPPRILIVDDNRSIHDDFRKILTDGTVDDELAELEADLFGTVEQPAGGQTFRLDSAYQGDEAVAALRAAVAEGDPYAVAFIDVRMPPGMDGIRTTEQLWTIAPDLEVVICTAYADYSWDEICKVLRTPDQYLILKKPFDNIEVRQLACALSEKWLLRRRANATREELKEMVEARTRALREATEQLQRESEERRLIEVELRNAQKLEAVGRLAAGIAHEINTPLQFIGDNLAFLGDATRSLWAAFDARRRAQVGTFATVGAHAPNEDRDERELDYLREEMPLALAQTVEGFHRVKHIVRALREFAQSDTTTKEGADVNRALDCTIEVARNEFVHVADVTTHYAELPLVPCYIGHLNQAFLHLIVNAAHAIGEQVAKGGARGRITIRTALSDDGVIVQVSDTGGGVPASIRDKIFEPFFTTKEVGRGAGQGLAIARSIVVDKHGGTLTLESTDGVGSTFTVRLPTDE